MGLFSRRKKVVWFDAQLTYDEADEVLARLRSEGVDDENLAAVLQEAGASDTQELLRPLGDLRAIPGRGLLDRRGESPKGGFFASVAPALPGVDPRTGGLMFFPKALVAECSGRERPEHEQVRWRIHPLDPLPDDVVEDLLADDWVVEGGAGSRQGDG